MSEPLHLRGIAKRFGETVVLRSIDLAIAAQRYTCIMGPSGSGKSTLLRIVAGLDAADAGDVLHGERSLRDVPAERRPTHTLFQEPALLPHMNVRDNVAFAGRLAGMPPAERGARAHALLEEVELEPSAFGDRDPYTLSGGERQRVAIARALVSPPAFLLLDEPLSALDRGLRDALRRKLVQLQRDHAIAFVHVTHEPSEALAIAEHLVVLIDGVIAASGAPAELFEHPPTLTVAKLLGEIARLPVGCIRPHRLRVRTDTDGRLPVVETARACLGAVWEMQLQHDERAIVAHAPSPPPGPVRSVDWDDADVLSLPP